MIAAARLKKAAADRNEAYKMIDELLANGDLTSKEHSTARADATAEFEQMKIQIMRESGSCYTAPSPSTSTESTLPVSPLSVSSPSVASSFSGGSSRPTSSVADSKRLKQPEGLRAHPGGTLLSSGSY
jgi:hypothetical protein